MSTIECGHKKKKVAMKLLPDMIRLFQSKVQKATVEGVAMMGGWTPIWLVLCLGALGLCGPVAPGVLWLCGSMVGVIATRTRKRSPISPTRANFPRPFSPPHFPPLSSVDTCRPQGHQECCDAVSAQEEGSDSLKARPLQIQH